MLYADAIVYKEMSFLPFDLVHLPKPLEYARTIEYKMRLARQLESNSGLIASLLESEDVVYVMTIIWTYIMGKVITPMVTSEMLQHTTFVGEVCLKMLLMYIY